MTFRPCRGRSLVGTDARSKETTMSDREPVAAENITAQYEDNRLQPADPGAVVPWEEARDRLAASDTYWLASVHPGGRPHVRPVLAVWVEGVLYSTSSPGARKARNLAENARCAVTASTDGIDLVIEGTASRVDDEATLQRVAEAYHSKYGWPVTVRDGAFDAPYAAPTAGPPPYQPYAVTPTVVLGLGTDGRFAPRSTRWRFS
jgi:nitroimidazol reductase NimA-like FMN-containing flavoprotein (pyridoxamine 5'-phosphate oxidase superfamily)